MELYKDVLRKKCDCMIGGDHNVDWNQANNPDERSDLKDLIPMPDDLLAEEHLGFRGFGNPFRVRFWPVGSLWRHILAELEQR